MVITKLCRSFGAKTDNVGMTCGKYEIIYNQKHAHERKHVVSGRAFSLVNYFLLQLSYANFAYVK